jgi:biopolymer transport protein ExbD
MPTCTSSWQLGCKCGIQCLWQSMGLLRRLDVIVLALMLMRVIAILGHVAHRHHSIRRSPAIDTNSRRIFAEELTQRLCTLRSIIHTAPFFGLAGSCIGIFDSFVGVGMQRGTSLAIITLNLSRALITTAAALLVTVPAIWSHDYLRTLLNLLRVDIRGRAYETTRRQKQCVGVAQSLPLKKQFSGLPSSAVTVAPCLALVIAGYMTFASFDISRGLPVGLLRPGERTARGEEYFTTDPVIIVIAMSGDVIPALYVDSKKTTWDELRTTIQGELKRRSRRVVYVQAEDAVSWMDVVNAVDIVELDATVVLSTTTPAMKSARGNRQQLGNWH